MKIAITGAGGRLGSALERRLAVQHDIVPLCRAAGAPERRLDICDYAACKDMLQRERPQLLLHSAAWTDVDGCARAPEKALQINGIATGHLAALTAQMGIPMLYVSSNEVFDGRLRRAYTEADEPAPVNAYGASKLYGERALAQVNPRHYIVRTAWLYARGGGNFVASILAAAAAGKRLRVVINEVANPTNTEDLAAAVAALISSERYGIYHLVNEGAVSRWAFARALLDETGYADMPIEPIAMQEWARASEPPEYAALANHAGASIGIRLRPWAHALRAFLAQAR